MRHVKTRKFTYNQKERVSSESINYLTLTLLHACFAPSAALPSQALLSIESFASKPLAARIQIKYVNE